MLKRVQKFVILGNMLIRYGVAKKASPDIFNG
jgi:hypothetical protein